MIHWCVGFSTVCSLRPHMEYHLIPAVLYKVSYPAVRYSRWAISSEHYEEFCTDCRPPPWQRVADYTAESTYNPLSPTPTYRSEAKHAALCPTAAELLHPAPSIR